MFFLQHNENILSYSLSSDHSEQKVVFMFEIWLENLLKYAFENNLSCFMRYFSNDTQCSVCKHRLRTGSERVFNIL